MPASDQDPRQKYLKEITFMPSSLETIDQAMHHHIDDKWNLHATTNKGWKKTPVVWVGAERAYQVKHDKEMRDSAGMLKLPMITIERTSVEKDPTRRGMAPANILPVNDIQGGSITMPMQISEAEISIPERSLDPAFIICSTSALAQSQIERSTRLSRFPCPPILLWDIRSRFTQNINNR